MFDYAREKEKLDNQLQGNLISINQYQNDIFYLNEANTKIMANKYQFAYHQIDGATYNQRELEIVREYEAKLTEHIMDDIKETERKQHKHRNVFALASIFIVVFTAVIIGIAITNNYKHRSIAGIPDPEQSITTGSITLKNEFNTVELEYTNSYKIDGLIVLKVIDKDTNAYSQSIPYVYGLAWGYAAANNSRITWSYNNRNIKAKDYGDLDRIAIQNSVSVNEIIPADDEVKQELEKYDLGDRVIIKGNLVKALIYNAVEEYTVKSSESRGDVNDSIAGSPTANEIIYVTSIEKVIDD